jgi:hypothetical protein
MEFIHPGTCARVSPPQKYHNFHQSNKSPTSASPAAVQFSIPLKLVIPFASYPSLTIVQFSMTSLYPSLLVTANAIPTPEIAKEIKLLLQFPLHITA